MGMEASATIEYWEGDGEPDGTRQWRCFGEYRVPQRGAALQLYALTGIGGGDPAYDLKDLSPYTREKYELDSDVVASKPMRIDANEIPAALARLDPSDPPERTVAAALDAVKRLGPHARLVFWMTM